MSYLDQDYREIITKAVIGKGKKFTQQKHIIQSPHKPSSILGCWVINHLYQAKHLSEDRVEINGSYELNVWYSYNDHTKTDVVTERVTYQDQIDLAAKDKQTVGSTVEVHARTLTQPQSVSCIIDKKDGKINTEVEREFMVEVIGDTKVSVRVDPSTMVDSSKNLDSDLKPDFFSGKQDSNEHTSH
ncbi:spore coat protein E [Pelagirhabdus alkalitolerans]|uniref:Spore coat protein E n=1 Tax=Pelagirhabdus alkalitolerans TaxID=1612202 RepID=A0A1G6H4Y6_9BACI|nr:outer spore coat protein CotE [Pelagirhabdus alkalitolerans]SDB89329.1 spore coat protein E [Pelagirhabdus alkalitolerans]